MVCPCTVCGDWGSDEQNTTRVQVAQSVILMGETARSPHTNAAYRNALPYKTPHTTAASIIQLAMYIDRQ